MEEVRECIEAIRLDRKRGASALAREALVNGTPTLALARAAQGRIPFYSLCESFKMDTDPALEPGFDLVPASLLTGVVTERGLLVPGEACRLFRGTAGRGGGRRG